MTLRGRVSLLHKGKGHYKENCSGLTELNYVKCLLHYSANIYITYAIMLQYYTHTHLPQFTMGLYSLINPL